LDGVGMTPPYRPWEECDPFIKQGRICLSKNNDFFRDSVAVQLKYWSLPFVLDSRGEHPGCYWMILK